MKILQRSICILILAVTLLTFLSACGARPNAKLHDKDDPGYIPCSIQMPELEIESTQAFIYDVQKSEFIYQKGESKVIYPASTAKLLTILCAMNFLSLDEVVVPGNELTLVPSDSSVAYVRSNHALTVEMLIEGMLLPSGNDAAYALAAAAGKRIASDDTIDGIQAVSIFMDTLNEYAYEIGLCGSHFATPDGYYSNDTYTTIEDIAIIALAASQNKIISKYSRLYSDHVVYHSGHTNTWVNTNEMLDPASKYFSPYVTGLKTGSTGPGNYNLITTVEINSSNYIIGVFSAYYRQDRYEDTLKIIRYLENR